MNSFWLGVAAGSVFWITVYAIAVIVWAIWNARNRGAEMMNTEAANDRVPEYVPNPIKEIGGQLRTQTRRSDLADWQAPAGRRGK